MKLTKKEKALLGLVLLMGMFYFYYTFYLSPILTEYKFLKNSLYVNEKKLGSLSKLEKEKQSIINEINGIKEKILELENKIPSNKKIPQLLDLLENYSLETNVNIIQISFENAEENKKETKNTPNKDKTKNLLNIPLQLSLIGTYENIISFIKKVETSERFLKVSNISIDRNYMINDNSLQVKLGINAYSLLYDGKLLPEPKTYDFMNNKFGSTNPFKPLPLEVKNSVSHEKNNTSNKNNQEQDTLNLQKEFLEDFINTILKN